MNPRKGYLLVRQNGQELYRTIYKTAFKMQCIAKKRDFSIVINDKYGNDRSLYSKLNSSSRSPCLP